MANQNLELNISKICSAISIIDFHQSPRRWLIYSWLSVSSVFAPHWVNHTEFDFKPTRTYMWLNQQMYNKQRSNQTLA